MKNSVLDLANLIQGFRLSRQIEGKSPKTTEWYAAFLERFRGLLEQSSLPTRVDRVDINCIRRFILYLKQEASARPGYSILKAVLSWLSYSR